MRLDGRMVISKDTCLSEFLQHIVARGVPDLTNDINAKSARNNPDAQAGFADIYRADLYNGARVAIKVYRGWGADEDWERRKYAWRGVYNWSKLRHPNIHELLGLTLFHNRIGVVSAWANNGNVMNYLERVPDADRLHLHGGVVHTR
ncbi:hypothetical protein B0J17DRAFT_242001 [Rhizoctonia solani]|nr:hypothetical protein B0J17DRAFT_242001 [Rhizoctonia solani]